MSSPLLFFVAAIWGLCLLAAMAGWGTAVKRVFLRDSSADIGWLTVIAETRSVSQSHADSGLRSLEIAAEALRFCQKSLRLHCFSVICTLKLFSRIAPLCPGEFLWRRDFTGGTMKKPIPAIAAIS